MTKREIEKFDTTVQAHTGKNGVIDFGSLHASLNAGGMVSMEKALDTLSEKAKLFPIRKNGYAAKKVACLGGEIMHVPYRVNKICVKHARKGLLWLEVDYLDTKSHPSDHYLYRIEMEGPVMAEVKESGMDAFFFEELSDDSIPLLKPEEINLAKEEIEEWLEVGVLDGCME